MATFTLRLSRKKNDLGYSEVMIRFRHGKIDVYSGSGVYIPIDKWDAEKETIIIPNIRVMSPEKTAEKKLLEKSQDNLNELKSIISSSFNEADKGDIEKDWMFKVIDKYYHPEKYDKRNEVKKLSFFEIMEDYLQKRKFSDVREKNFRVLIRALKRYEKVVSKIKRQQYSLELNKITADTISDIESFLRNEHNLCKEYPALYKELPLIDGKRKSPEPKPRGNNTICALFNKLRAFFNWCFDKGIMINRPFAGYDGITTEKYGTPYYLSLDERNIIADFDLSNRPYLAIQRDIFIFQCLIGCRVSDLIKMTSDNVIRGAIEYIPNKTKDDKPLVVRVPLNDRAKDLIKKYNGVDKQGMLFPFISEQKYNKDIKQIFTLCDVNRLVTIQNPTTGDEEKRPLNEIASSHLARRTFVGNLYKQVKDPNLVGSLSGHTEGSKAFARYRDIDEEMKTELVKMLE